MGNIIMVVAVLLSHMLISPVASINPNTMRSPLVPVSLLESDMVIAEDQYEVKRSAIGITTRIGVDYAGPDALLPYRFIVKNNPYVSGKKS